MNELISIIIPTYKRADKLVRALGSCLNQTYKKIEVLVIDDNNEGSDFRYNTEKIMDRYKENSKVRYIKRKQNGGGAIARNTGIQEAKGKYITFLDDDDEYFRNKIELQVKEIKKGFDMIFSDIEIYHVDTGFKQIQTYKKNFDLTYKGLLTKHLVDVISGTPTFMFKKEALERIGGFDDIPANQEYILMLKTITSKLKVGYLDQVLCRAYINDGDSRISVMESAVEAKIDVIRRVRPFLKDIDFRDRRRTMYRLNSFVFYQYLKRKKLKAIVYGIRLMPYIDLLIRYMARIKDNKSKVLCK